VHIGHHLGSSAWKRQGNVWDFLFFWRAVTLNKFLQGADLMSVTRYTRRKIDRCGTAEVKLWCVCNCRVRQNDDEQVVDVWWTEHYVICASHCSCT